MPNAVDRPGLLAQLTRLAATWGPAALMMGLIYFFSSWSRPLAPLQPGLLREGASVIGHFGEYALLALALRWGLRRQWPQLHPVGRLAWALALLYAVSDEWHQSFVPGRVPDPLDLLVDGLGAATGLLWAARRERRRARSLTQGASATS